MLTVKREVEPTHEHNSYELIKPEVCGRINEHYKIGYMKCVAGTKPGPPVREFVLILLQKRVSGVRVHTNWAGVSTLSPGLSAFGASSAPTLCCWHCSNPSGNKPAAVDVIGMAGNKSYFHPSFLNYPSTYTTSHDDLIH
jgi:hypothetical protein